MKFKKKKMTRERCIEELRGSMGLFLFDPFTGEVQEPEYLNETDRMIYDAMAYAADFLEARPPQGKHSYYFTFGSDPEFPFGINNYVEVHADYEDQACEKFRSRYPNREGSDLINCAFIYTEPQWADVGERFYKGIPPVRVID